MKHKIQKVELFIGVIIFLGGLLTYGLGVHQLLPVPRPDLVNITVRQSRQSGVARATCPD